MFAFMLIFLPNNVNATIWAHGNKAKKDVKRERSDNQTGCKQTTMFSRVI